VGRLDKTAVVDALNQLLSLSPDWDGYGAETISAAIVDSARRFVMALPDDIVPAPQVVPMTRGRLQLEWHRGHRSLELEFETSATVHYLKWDSDIGVEQEDVLPLRNTGEILSLISWFMSE